MLSFDLLSLSREFAERIGGGMQIDPEGVATMAALFRDLGEQAQKLEAQIVPALARVVPADLPKDGNVIPLPARPKQRAVSILEPAS